MQLSVTSWFEEGKDNRLSHQRWRQVIGVTRKIVMAVERSSSGREIINTRPEGSSGVAQMALLVESTVVRVPGERKTDFCNSSQRQYGQTAFSVLLITTKRQSQLCCDISYTEISIKIHTIKHSEKNIKGSDTANTNQSF